MNQLLVKRTVIDFDELCRISSIFEGKEWLANWVMHTLSVDRINELYSRNCDYHGAAFAQRILEDLEINLCIENEYYLDTLHNGKFITVSNHPFGALDGIILIKLIGSRFPEFKIMVNMVLNYIKVLRGNFIAVDPFSSDNSNRRMITMRGIRAVMDNIQQGMPVGFFPAGAVSKVNSNLRVEDRAWQPSIIRLIQQLKVPVIPIHFYGGNSMWFNLLGMVNWRLRSLLLPSEVFAKQRSEIRVVIGEPITLEQIECYKNPKELGEFLKKKTYSI